MATSDGPVAMPAGAGTVVEMSASILQASRQVWPPFVLVTGLLLIGAVVEADGLFEAVGSRLGRFAGGACVLLAVLLGLDAVVSAVLNLALLTHPWVAFVGRPGSGGQ